MKIYSTLLGITLSFLSYSAIAQCSASILEEFDSQTACGTNCGNACTINGFWSNSLNDDIDWTVDAVGTPSGSTGPSADHTSGSGNYIYTEASGCTGDTAILISQSIDLSAAPGYAMEFWYHMFGSTMGNLFVEVSIDSLATWVQLDSLKDNMDLWQFRSINLSAYINDTIFLRFRGITGTGLSSDMALDDINLKVLQTNDADVAGFTGPINPITSGINNVDFLIKNTGIYFIELDGYKKKLILTK